MAAPQLAVGGQPCVEVRERLGADAVLTPLRVHARLHQPRVSQHAQVLGDGGLAEPQRCDELPDGPFALAQQLEDRLPARLGEGLEGGELAHANLVCPTGYMTVKVS